MSASPRGAGPVLWLGVLVCVAAAGGLIWMLMSGTNVKGAKGKPKGPLYAQDPGVDQVVQLPAADLSGAAIKPGEAHGPVLLVALPGCSDCSVGEFDPAKIDTSRYGEILLLSSGRVFLSALSRKLPAGKWRFLPDNNDKAALGLNANFIPRAYVLTEDWKVQAVQQPREDINAFIKQHGG